MIMNARLLVLVLLFGGLLTAPSAAAPFQAARPLVADQYIVAITAGRDARGIARAAGVMPQHVFSRVLNGFVATLNAGQRMALQRHPDVVLVEPDQIVQATGTQPIDPASGLWGLDRIDQRTLPLAGSYAYGPNGADVTAYIIDSGLQANHPDFGTRGQNVYDAFAESGNDCNGHGTHLAGIVGGTTHGVAKQINLRGVRVLQCDAQGLVSDAIRGIDWVAVNAVKPAVATIAFSPVNLSSSNSATLQLAVENLINTGVFVAVAAGNGNTDGCTAAPANISAAFTVAASTRTDQRYAASNYGACVDSYAPGAGITSAWIGSTTNTLSGTSQATAFVAGAAALYQAANGTTPQATINAWLIITALPNVIQNNVTSTPNRLLNLSALTFSLSAGGYHNCGVRSDQTLTCWGHAYYGEATPPSGTFTQVSAGDYYTCGVRTDETLTCWGANDYGRATPPSGSFRQVSAGDLHTCGVRTDKTLACWGYNPDGRATPPSGSFRQVSADSYYTCALRTNQTVACWGQDYSGETIPPSGSFRQVSTGANHTCGIRADQTITCWGSNYTGQVTSPSGTFTQVNVGSWHTCGVRTDSTLACWGSNDYGQSTPPSGTFTQVSAGDTHTCAIRTDQTLACWGRNNSGQTTLPTNWY